ncbi:hypothetical protein F8388_016112 [Cannabis sativa]|uniref:Uncharacterized protein n=1 Tax=Cannabis sativa TaxID=3483 RepID=A0A7J6DJ40_CANSA|nr:hypothetical protein G4B88_012612 [Cannabis sativa]KAF4370375.1 hypothetical protein F8388_016112 [Cannabis sativa]
MLAISLVQRRTSHSSGEAVRSQANPSLLTNPSLLRRSRAITGPNGLQRSFFSIGV